MPADSAIVQRRNLVLELLADDPSRRVLTGEHVHDRGLPRGQEEPLVSSRRRPGALAAPHFVWYVREELRERALR